MGESKGKLKSGENSYPKAANDTPDQGCRPENLGENSNCKGDLLNSIPTTTRPKIRKKRKGPYPPGKMPKRKEEGGLKGEKKPNRSPKKKTFRWEETASGDLTPGQK